MRADFQTKRGLLLPDDFDDDEKDPVTDSQEESKELDSIESLLDSDLGDSDLAKLIGKKDKEMKGMDFPEELFVLPLSKRPFFPGMAAPLIIEPGAYYEVLKIVAKSPHKTLGLFLTKEEDANVYDLGFEDLCDVGVMASILRIVPLEQGGAQVVLNMEKRIQIKKPIKKSKYLRCLLYTSPSPRDGLLSRMPSSA